MTAPLRANPGTALQELRLENMAHAKALIRELYSERARLVEALRAAAVALGGARDYNHADQAFALLRELDGE